MSTVRLTDIIEPSEFTGYVTQETMKKSALVQSGVATQNDAIRQQLSAGAHSFTVPFWRDLEDTEADIVSDDPAENSTPGKIASGKQIVRKAFLHSSWSAMNLASEISGDNALTAIQRRVTAYWTRQWQSRLIASLNGIKADNEANDASDMVHDISAETGNAANFSASAVIDASGLLGDSMNSLTGIALHSDVYRKALKTDMIEFIPDSQGKQFATFRGLAVVIDDGLTVDTGKYTSVLFGQNAVGYAAAEPRVADGTEVESLPSAGNGGGQQVLHSRMNFSMHPAGFSWQETAVTGESPSVAELADATNWDRVIERKSVPLSFLVSKVG
jgi:hypothetical protein